MSSNGNKSTQETAAGASSSRQASRADPLAAFPRRGRTQRAPSGNPSRGTTPSLIPTTVRAGPVTRAVLRDQSAGFQPTHAEASRSEIFTPMSPDRSYSSMVASPSARSPTTSPNGTSPNWSKTLVPAMIRHFEKYDITISPSPPSKATSPSAPSRVPPLSPQAAAARRTTSPGQSRHYECAFCTRTPT